MRILQFTAQSLPNSFQEAGSHLKIYFSTACFYQDILRTKNNLKFTLTNFYKKCFFKIACVLLVLALSSSLLIIKRYFTDINMHSFMRKLKYLTFPSMKVQPLRGRSTYILVGWTEQYKTWKPKIFAKKIMNNFDSKFVYYWKKSRLNNTKSWARN